MAELLADRFIEICSISNKVTVLLESGSGQGSCIPSTIEDLVCLYKKIREKTEYIGICLDTCHVFASGYDLSNISIFTELVKYIEHEVGLEAVKVLHINDSKKPLGSKVDRHENIGEGLLGIKAFEYIMKHPYFKTVPKILETPFETLDDHKKNLEKLISLT
jgi:deoxyribonuclease-4